MSRKNTKVFIILIAALFGIIAALSLLAPTRNTSEVKAEGGNIAYNENALTLNMDVNGDSYGSSIEDNQDSITSTYNLIAHLYRSRTIRFNALSRAYFSMSGAVTLRTGDQITVAQNVGGKNNVNNNMFGYNTNTGALIAETTTVSSTNLNYDRVTFRAVSAPSAVAPIYFMYYAMITHTDATTEVHPVYLKFVISSTIAIPYEANGITSGDLTELYFDEKRTTSGAINENYDPTLSSVTVTNNKLTSINLSDRIAKSSTYVYRMVNGSQEILRCSDGTPWTIADVKHLKVESVGSKAFGTDSDAFSASITDYTKVTSSSSASKVYFDPIISLSASLTNSNISTYYLLKGETVNINNFFTTPQPLDYTVVTENVNSIMSASYTFYIKTQFAPGNTPVIKDLQNVYTSLNLSSDYIYDVAGNRYYNKRNNALVPDDEVNTEYGYYGVILTPDDLLEYPRTTDSKLYFSAKTIADSANAVFDIRQELGETSLPVSIRITAKTNGEYPIKFSFASSSGGAQIQVPDLSVSFSAFGNYKLSKTINKNVARINIFRDNDFKQIVDDGYALDSCESNSPNILTATSDNSVVTLTPKSSALKDEITNVTVTLVFSKNGAQKVRVNANISIDTSANGFFSLFEAEWMGWLVIGAICLGVLIIVLIILYIFLHSLSKSKQHVYETVAPTSSYIIKLNNQIAAAQNRIVQQPQYLALGAAPMPSGDPNTLALAAGTSAAPEGVSSDYAIGAARHETVERERTSIISETPPPTTMYTATREAPQEDNRSLYELIAGYISDERLLERIFTEKYEPKGMQRRTFFKSKDLQERELEKEKSRIIQRYKTPMPMKEAILSEKEAEAAKNGFVGIKIRTPEEINTALGFEATSVTKDIREVALKNYDNESVILDVDAKSHYELIKLTIEKNNKVMEIAQKRMEVLSEELAKEVEQQTSVTSVRDGLANDIDMCKKAIEDLEVKLATAKAKDKDHIQNEISTKESLITSYEMQLNNYKKPVDEINANVDFLNAADKTLAAYIADLKLSLAKSNKEIIDAKEAYDKAIEEEKEFQKNQKRKATIAAVEPLIREVLVLKNDIDKTENENIELNKERELIRAEVASLRAKLLKSKDSGDIATINEQINRCNNFLKTVDLKITENGSKKSDLTLKYSSARHKANDYIEKNELSLTDVIKIEDGVYGGLIVEFMRADINAEIEEKQALIDKTNSEMQEFSDGDTNLIEYEQMYDGKINEISDRIKESEDRLDEYNNKIGTLTDATEISETQMLIGTAIAALQSDKTLLETVQNEYESGKIMKQAEHETKLEKFNTQLEEYDSEVNTLRARLSTVDETAVASEMLSGSGSVSQDQRKVLLDSLKSKLSEAKSNQELEALNIQITSLNIEQQNVVNYLKYNAAKIEADMVVKATRRVTAFLEDVRKVYVEKMDKEKEALIKKADELREKALKNYEDAFMIIQTKINSDKAPRAAEIERKRNEAVEAADNVKAEDIAALDESLSEDERAAAEEAINDAYTEAVNAANAEYTSALSTLGDDITKSHQGEIDEATSARDAQLAEAEKIRASAQVKWDELQLQYLKESEASRATLDTVCSNAEDVRKKALEDVQKAKSEAEEATQRAREEARIMREQYEKEKQEAQNEANKAKKEAEEARKLAEEAMLQAQAEAESARRQAQEDAAAAKLAAQEEANEARRLAQEETERAKQEAQEEAERVRKEAEEMRQKAIEEAEKAKQEAMAAAEAARQETLRIQQEAEEAKRKAQEDAERAAQEAEEARRKAQEEAEEAKRKALEEAEEARRIAQEQAEEAKRKAQEEAEEAKRKAQEEEEAKRKQEEEEKARLEKEEAEKRARIEEKIQRRKAQIAEMRNELSSITDEASASAVSDRFYNLQIGLDEDERNNAEIIAMISKAMDDAAHRGQVASLKAEADKKPQRTLKKVTQRVNVRPSGSRPAGSRPSGSRPAGSRPAGARPSGSRPAGSRPAGSRPTGSRPAGSRPAGSRPAGSRPPTKRPPTR